jgi:hypothetical protein
MMVYAPDEKIILRFREKGMTSMANVTWASNSRLKDLYSISGQDNITDKFICT